MAGEIDDGIGAGQREERRYDGGAVDLGISFLHVVAEVSAELRGLGEGIEALVLDLGAVRRLGGPGDPQTTGRGTDLGLERSRRRRSDVRITRPGCRGRVEQRRAIAHAQRHRVLGRAAAEAFTRVGRERVAPTGGLETDQPAAGGWSANGPKAVAGVGHRQHAGSDGSGGAAARAAGDAREVPRRARRAEELGLAGQRESQLARVGAAEEDEAGALEAFDVLAVDRGRRRIGEEARAACHRQPGHDSGEVFQEKRHPAERPVGQALGDLPAPVVVETHDDGVDLGIALLHLGDGRLQERERRHFAATNEGRQGECVVVLVVSEFFHGAAW